MRRILSCGAADPRCCDLGVSARRSRGRLLARPLRGQNLRERRRAEVAVSPAEAREDRAGQALSAGALSARAGERRHATTYLQLYIGAERIRQGRESAEVSVLRRGPAMSARQALGPQELEDLLAPKYAMSEKAVASRGRWCWNWSTSFTADVAHRQETNLRDGPFAWADSARGMLIAAAARASLRRPFPSVAAATSPRRRN